VKLDNSERILEALKKEGVPCELIVMQGAGHGFPGKQGKDASEALLEWFDKHLAKPADVESKANESETREKAAAAQ
jgi:dipeptidyl aminopeptidase/acylaminoacyl peptidase